MDMDMDEMIHRLIYLKSEAIGMIPNITNSFLFFFFFHYMIGVLT